MVYGIEGKNFLLGVGLSPEVENAVQEVVEQVAHEIQGWKNNLPPYNAM
jgi:Ni,Fe-hydrogenase maturation factor